MACYWQHAFYQGKNITTLNYLILTSMKKVTLLLLIFGCIFSMHAACGQKKITLYTSDFTGTKEELSAGKYDYMSLVRLGFSTVKSIKVPSGMKVTLYERDNFEGYTLEVTSDANTRFLEQKGFAKTAMSVSLMVEEYTAPATGEYITLYKDDFAGASLNLIVGQYESYELGNVGNDQLSSIKIPKGMKVTLYEHGGFKGRTLVLTKDTRAAFFVSNKFNDLASSIMVEKEPEPIPAAPVVAPIIIVMPSKPASTPAPVVVEEKIIEPTAPVIYEGDFTGKSFYLEAGRYSNDQMNIANDQLSSVKVPVGFRVTLFEHDAFEGRSLVLSRDARAGYLADQNFNNITSSILVEVIPVVTIYEGDYSGASHKVEPGKYDLAELGIKNDQLSSVRVPKGLRVTLYDNAGFSGRKLELTGDSGTDVIKQNSFDNITSSLVVSHVVEPVVEEKIIPTVTLFQEDFGGVSRQLPVGRYRPTQLGIANNSLSSISIPRGLQVSLYDNDTFDGRSMILRDDAGMNFFANSEFDDITSSIVIEEIFSSDLGVTVYADRFSGASQKLIPGQYLLKNLSVGDKQISSAKVPEGMRITFHEDDQFKGYSLTAESDIDLTVSKVFDNRTSSVIVEDIFEPIVTPVIAKPAVAPVSPAPTVPVVMLPACDMTSDQFQIAFEAMKAKSWDDDKMTTAKLSTKDKCLTNLQIKTMAGLFMNDDQTLTFLKYAYDVSSEKPSYYLLGDVLKFMSSKDAFTKFLVGK
jgi:hypothetical protein